MWMEYLKSKFKKKNKKNIGIHDIYGIIILKQTTTNLITRLEKVNTRRREKKVQNHFQVKVNR